MAQVMLNHAAYGGTAKDFGCHQIKETSKQLKAESLNIISLIRSINS
jgi:hypothetical protein